MSDRTSAPTSTTTLDLRVLPGGERLVFQAERLVVAGFTGRDRDKVHDHIDELERIGVPAPDSVPTFYDLHVDLLTQDEVIAVESDRTSGEAEPVLFFAPEGRWFVGIGSDHTARDLERESIATSKAACPKPVGTDVFTYGDVRDRWDDLVVRSRVEGELYQEARLEEILPIPRLLDALTEQVDVDQEGLVLFLGTVPLRTDEFVYGHTFHAELETPDEGRRTSFRYRIDRRT